MSLTANYDYCAEFTIEVIRSIFHEAFRDETVAGDPMFPHNFGPFDRNFSGRAATINVRVYDDVDRPADLEFQDTKHMRFTFPIDISVKLHDSPDPTLSEVILASVVKVPAALATWLESHANNVAADDLADILAELESMSDDEARALLASEQPEVS